MPAAQSFIQILGTFLATLFISYSRAFSFIKKKYLHLENSKKHW